jgi:hypothetical protein
MGSCRWELNANEKCGEPTSDDRLLCAFHKECSNRGEFGAGPAPKPETVGKDTNPKDAIASTKIALSLCSPIAKAYWSAAQYAGLTKYGAWNWRISGVRASVYLNAMERHMDAYNSGEELDPIDGTRHLGNIMACCAILLDAEAAGKLTDDRPPSVDIRPTYAEVEACNKAVKEKYQAMTPKHYTIADTEKSS